MNPVIHIELSVADLDRAIAFYAAVLRRPIGEPFALHDSLVAELDFNEDGRGASMALVQGPEYCPGREGARVYFHVDDIHAVLARALQHGGAEAFPVTAAGTRWWVAEFIDSEGNQVALQAMRT